MTIQPGDSLPSGQLQEGNPGATVDPAAEFGSGTTIIFGVPGAFTPGCSNTHLPGYVADAESLAAKGVDAIACVSVNDAFVMGAWGESQGAEGKVRMLADPQAEFTTAMGLEVDAGAVLGGVRSKRYAMIVKDGVVSDIEVEPDGFGLTCSLSSSIADKL
ncbi:MAG: peroxiredoxin [Actinomycetota bacterium]